ncbi:MAG TPA: M24 family metallopeptidase [Thermoanaerobaculia bacterium]
MLAERIPAIQSALEDAGLDSWLFAVFQHNDPISLDLLGLGGTKLVTRRCYYLVPRQGDPRKLVHGLEPHMLDHLPGDKSSYLTWQQHRERFAAFVAGQRRMAAQYSPNNELPSVSRLDAGTAELRRAAGVELVSAADLAQRFAATWSDEQLATHRRASTHLHAIVLDAMGRVGAELRASRTLDEHTVQNWIVEAFDRAGLWAESPPTVGVNAHSADPHYQPSPTGSAPIRSGDFLLIDLWAKEKKNQAESIYADICWCGVCAPSPTDRQAEVFAHVARARDAAFDLIRSRFPHTPVRGFEVDDAARAVIVQAGYGDAFVHRTGHSIGTSDHGQGANMDNFETHDTRTLLPMTGFSIEPGIYLTGDFGVRSEINVALTATGVEATGGLPQRELLRLLA